MATAIKPTRTLFGKEAESLSTRIKKWQKKPVTKLIFKRAEKTFKKMEKKHPDWLF